MSGVRRIRLLDWRQIWPGTQRRKAVRGLELVEIERGLARIVYGGAGKMQCAFGSSRRWLTPANSGAIAAALGKCSGRRGSQDRHRDKQGWLFVTNLF
jgi:hypothetical protein